MGKLIIGVSLTPLKIIPGELGNVMHFLKRSERDFHGFGEAYFSTVNTGAVKGWKKHQRMILNMVVVSGEIRFVIFDDRPASGTCGDYFEVTLSPQRNYSRISIDPGLWVAFEGISEGENILLNLASIEHDPSEAENYPVSLGKIVYPFKS